MTTTITFKEVKPGEHFVYHDILYEKVIQSQDVLGTYNAISRSAPTGSKVVWLGENTVVEVRNNG